MSDDLLQFLRSNTEDLSPNEAAAVRSAHIDAQRAQSMTAADWMRLGVTAPHAALFAALLSGGPAPPLPPPPTVGRGPLGRPLDIGSADLVPGPTRGGGYGSVLRPDHPFFGAGTSSPAGWAPPGGVFPPPPGARFDPVLPPGATDPFARGRPRDRGRFSYGEPNPDHMRRPFDDRPGFL